MAHRRIFRSSKPSLKVINNKLKALVRVTLGESGAGGGLRKFCRGETQISNALRPITASEMAACRAAGVQFVEISAFLAFLDADSAYEMYGAVSATKMALSHGEEAQFSFHAAGVAIERTIKRADFETWIAPELAETGACVDRALSEARLREADIDRVWASADCT